MCSACSGNGAKVIQRQIFDTCKRCNGARGKRSGKVWVPCSGCGGTGGKNRTISSSENCCACNGTGRRSGAWSMAYRVVTT